MGESPYSPPDVTAQSTTSPISEWAIVKQWLVFTVLSTLLGFLAGAVAGGIVGAFLGAAQASMQTIQRTGAIVGGIAALPVSYACFRMSVKKLLAIRDHS